MKTEKKLSSQGDFSGWYCKQAGPDGVLALIIGRWQKGETGGCFLQAVTEEESFQVQLPLEEWWERPGLQRDRRPMVRLGNSIFTPAGVWLDLTAEGRRIQGELHYGPLRPLTKDIMGPLAHIPRLECRHLVVSTTHPVEGWVSLGERTMDFTGGVGYWEGDRGHSFPRRYQWVQCNRFDRPGFAVTAAVADLPVGPWSVEGCFCTLTGARGELRLATYLGARVVESRPGRMVLRQREWCITLAWTPGKGKPLAAPQGGQMDRVIQETAQTDLTVLVRRNGKEELRLRGVQASTEDMEGA